MVSVCHVSNIFFIKLLSLGATEIACILVTPCEPADRIEVSG